MHLFRKFSLFVGCLALATSGGLAAKKEDKPAAKTDAKGDKSKGDAKPAAKDGKGDKKKGDGSTPPNADPNAPKAIAVPIIPGHPAMGLKIPYFDGKGNLQMMFTIGTANRLAGDDVAMDSMQVETYNEEGEPEMTIDLPKSVLNLVTHVITSDTQTTIKRDDFTITGDRVEFNTDKRQGKLVGNVHMTIYNIKAEAEPPSQPIAPPLNAAEAPSR